MKSRPRRKFQLPGYDRTQTKIGDKEVDEEKNGIPYRLNSSMHSSVNKAEEWLVLSER